MARSSFSLGRFVSISLMSVLAAGAGYLGFRVLRSEIAAAVYRDRLASLAKDYEALRGRYNEAVKQSAVTELVVKEGRLSVEVRSREGVVRTIATPLDPSREVYVDYAVVGGRLLIRRVFDAKTPPEEGQVIDAALAGVDWNSPEASHGKAVYRTLGEGRWTISVSGNGALTLSKNDSAEPMSLVSAPPLRTYEEELAAMKAEVEAIGFRDVVRSVMGR
jgi:hypothetical protein